jgi:hypothetical protein
VIAAGALLGIAACGSSPAPSQHAASSSAAPTTAPLRATYDTVDRLRAEAAAQQGFGYVWGAPEIGGCGRVYLRAPSGVTVNVDTAAMYGGHGAELQPGEELQWGCSSGVALPGQTATPAATPAPTPQLRVEADAKAAAAKGYGYGWTTVTGSGNPCVDVHVTLAGATYSFPAQWISDVRLVPVGGHALLRDNDPQRGETCTR